MQVVSAVALTAALAGLAFWRFSPQSSATLELTKVIHLPVENFKEPYQYDPPPDTADESALIDLRNFTFLTSVPGCNASAPAPLYVVLVHSAPGHRERRDAIRHTWGRLVPHLVFLVGETNNTAARGDLEAEVARYGDVVQGNFLDSYRNLTYKHVMGLKWVAYYCPSTKYVVKLDDDVYVNTPQLEKFLPPNGARRLIVCDIQERGMVKRSYRSKWRVTPSEYSGEFYPTYCAGWAVVYSPDAAYQLYRTAQRSPYFWVDDVHITGMMAALLNLTHVDMDFTPYMTWNEAEVEEWMQRRELPEEFIFAMTSWENYQSIWDLLQEDANRVPSPSKAS